jgi:hypothetical protein
MIIWIASYPRSGNQFLQLLLWRGYRFFPYSLYLDEECKKRPPEILTRWQTLFDIPLLKSVELPMMQSTSDLYCVKTHELPQDNFPAIYLVRDGRDALVSYARFILTFEAPHTDFGSILRNLIVKSDFFGGWGTHVFRWTKRQAPTVILRFEEFIQAPDPFQLIQQAFNCFGYQYPGGTASPHLSLPTFQELHALLPELFRKGQIGSWQTEMSVELQELFWQKHGDAMRHMGYTEGVRVDGCY